jgi:predicted nucleic acid-binding protein
VNGARPDSIADTSAVILLSRRDAEAERRLEGKNFAITFVTLAELHLGILKTNDQIAALRRVLEVLTGQSICHTSAITSMLYADIYYDLEKRGEMIPVNDIWIAASALENRLPLLARDQHFSKVRGLSVIEC